MSCKVEFRGGLEHDFGQKNMQVELASEMSVIALANSLQALSGAKELVQETIIRPGILVLINDCDMEIFEGEATKVNSGDVVTFLSSVHGG